MLNENNAIDILIIGTIVSGFIGLWIGCILFAERESIEMKKRRKELRRGVTNYARRRAVLALNSEVIKGGEH